MLCYSVLDHPTIIYSSISPRADNDKHKVSESTSVINYHKSKQSNTMNTSESPIYVSTSTFHVFTVASAPTLATALPFSIHATPFTPSLCELGALTRAPGFTMLQTNTLVSIPPLTACVPSVFHAIEVTLAVWLDQRSVTTFQVLES